jgi:hypothetical protein
MFREIRSWNQKHAGAVSNKDAPSKHFDDYKTKFEDKLPHCCTGIAAVVENKSASPPVAA